MPQHLTGVLAPVVTPFREDYTPDADRLIAQCRWLLEQDCGLAVFGTNSEGNSLSVDEKIMLLDRLVAAGLPPARMMPGTGACALSDAVRLTRHAASLGCGGVLMLPPFYYKDVTDEGLFRSFAQIIEQVKDDRLRIYLYHIPPVAQIGFSLDLIDRLIRAFPRIIAGIKDSSNDYANTRAMLERFPGWGIFCGNELNLVDAMTRGGAGCISATNNINPGPIARLAATWQAADAHARQESINTLRKTVAAFPMIPALKAVVARGRGDATWARVRPPLVELTAAEQAKLFAALDALQFTMPGLAAA